MRPITLSPRLRSVAERVPRGARFADVGTDHAYLPVWLLQQGVVERAIAADLRPGPLDRARATAEKYGLTDRIRFYLCDGLSGISGEEADTVAIAGMGGETIAAILAAAPWTLERGTRLHLQPMSAQPELRRWLQDHGYAILEERLSKEGNTLYTMFTVQAGPMAELSLGELWAGRQSAGADDPLRGEYLERLILQAARAAEGLRKSTRTGDELRLAEWERLEKALREMKEAWLTWRA